MDDFGEDPSIHKKVFKSQLKELLGEVHSKKKLSILVPICDAIKSTPRPDKLQLHSEGLTFIPEVPDNIKQFTFHSPTIVHHIGSSAVGCALKRPCTFHDLAVEIPNKGFKDKLLKNYGFFYRRLLYLSEIGRHLLMNCNFVQSIEWDTESDFKRPDLLLTLKNHEDRFMVDHRVRLTTVVSLQAFNPLRFRPDRSNLHHHESTPLGVSTPVYNSLLAKEVCRLTNHNHISELLNAETKICQGIILFKVWLKQRALLKSCGGLSEELVETLAAYLLQSDIINRIMSPYIVFQTILQYLSESTSWTSQGVQTRSSSSSLSDHEDDNNMMSNLKEKRPTLEVMHSAYPIVFIGASGYDNLAAQISHYTYNWLIFEARQSVIYMKNENGTTFDALFMSSQNVFEKFDHVIVLKQSDMLKSVVEKHSLSDKLIDLSGDVSRVVLPVVTDYLIRCLDKRLVALNVDLDSMSNNRSNGGPILIGLILNMNLSSVQIDRGPQCATDEAKEFRKLWSDKSEMRHIDGDLRECLVWSGKQNVMIEIVQYILQHLLGLKATFNNCHQINPSLSDFISYPAQVLKRIDKTQLEVSVTLGNIKDELCAALRSLNTDLPLDITSVRAVNASCRCTSVFPPLPVADELVTISKEGKKDITVKRKNNLFPVYAPVQHLIVSLELSGKWPDDLDLFYQMKKLFLIRIHTLFNDKKINSKVHDDGYLDVYKSGYLFRIHLAQPKEAYLLRKLKRQIGVVDVDSPQSRAWERLHIHLPHLSAIISGLVARWPRIFDTACRLAKRWLSGQCCELFESGGDEETDTSLIPFGMNEVVVELLVAVSFLSPQPYTEPASGLSAFLRFLRLFAYHDWESRPLILNLKEELTDIDVEELSSAFHRDRDQLPAMVIITSVDHKGDRWTYNGPSRTGLKELQLLARQTHAVLNEIFLGTNYEKLIKAVFRADKSDFNAIMEVSYPTLSLHLHEMLDLDSKQADKLRNCYYYPPTDEWPSMLIDKEPVQQVVNTMRKVFGDSCELRHNQFGCEWIGIKWKRSGGKDPVETQLYREHILQSIATQATKGSVINLIKVIK